MKTFPLPLLDFSATLQRLRAAPTYATEESIALRIVVQLLVIVGIVATDVAAGTRISVWAVPLSIVGSLWSWWRRKQRNVAVKFVLAIAMLGALFVFLGNLLENINDTRLILAELLIQVQVLHSFDLPRRRDLGYSMVIGLILLAVAGTLSETLAFAPFLAVFLAIALPSLVLDYRSRLGLLAGATRPARSSASSSRRPAQPQWLTIAGLFAVIVVLGLGLFALMPRFPGYQLQTFPVNAPGDFDTFRFEGNNPSIMSPGDRAGENGESGSPDGTGTAGSAEEFVFYGFSQEIDQIGGGNPDDLPSEPKLLMRVRSQAPGFWRVLGFDRYTGRGWEISRDAQTLPLSRPAWSFRFDLGLLYPPTQYREIIQTYVITAPMTNLIPTLNHPRALYFPTPEIAIDPEGNLRAPAALTEELTYTAISRVPERDRTQLGQLGQDYPEPIRKYYLALPEGLAEQVRPFAEELLKAAGDRPQNPYEITLLLAQELKQRYQIQENPVFLPGEDLTLAFLRQGGGYPDHFPTVLTVMLRSLGIPARMAAGFGPGQFNPFTGFYLVRTSDAFFVNEVFFPGHGWYAFDPIPGHELIPPSYVDNETFGVVRQLWNWVAGWLPSPLRGWFAFAWQMTLGGLIQGAIALWRWMSSGLLGFLTGLMGLTAVGFLLWLGWLPLMRWWRSRQLQRLPPMERLYLQMLDRLRDRGHPKSPAQTPWEYVASCEQVYPDAIATVVRQITAAYLDWRYGGTEPEVAPLAAQLQTLRTPWGQRPARSRVS